jgi:hypothetical protein
MNCSAFAIVSLEYDEGIEESLDLKRRFTLQHIYVPVPSEPLSMDV